MKGRPLREERRATGEPRDQKEKGPKIRTMDRRAERSPTDPPSTLEPLAHNIEPSQHPQAQELRTPSRAADTQMMDGTPVDWESWADEAAVAEAAALEALQRPGPGNELPKRRRSSTNSADNPTSPRPLPAKGRTSPPAADPPMQDATSTPRTDPPPRQTKQREQAMEQRMGSAESDSESEVDTRQ